MEHHGVWPIYVFILLTCLAKCSKSLPINDQEESRPRLTEYDTTRHAGRTLKAIDWDSCEFGDNLHLDRYDESCLNGAKGILPCNPGQFKVAECIGQDGDTSKMCDLCPPTYYQRFYNRCTKCHQCSECGSNGLIKQQCTDETDTTCESIIPPDPVVPTTTPTPTADAPVPSVSTQNIDESTPRVPDATTAVSTLQTTRKGPIYTEGFNWKALAISAIVLCAVLGLGVVILVHRTRKQKAKTMEPKREHQNIIRNDMPCDGGHEERGGSVHQSGKSKSKSNGNNIPMKKRNSSSPASASEDRADPENVQDPSAAHHDSDTHRDAPSRPKPSPNYEHLNGTNQTNMEAPSTSGGSGSINSDGPCATGPGQDDGGAIADPPKNHPLNDAKAKTRTVAQSGSSDATASYM